MRLPDGGLDLFYIDESMKPPVYSMSAVSVPFLRSVEGTWTLVWEDQLDNAREWRRAASRDFGIPVRKELKGSKLLSGRGRYYRGQHQIRRHRAVRVYRELLERLAFLQPSSIITVTGFQPSLYGHTRVEAVLYALLQRMRTACDRAPGQRAGMVFFDEGHAEYRRIYRKARVWLPTGSNLGSWPDGRSSLNLPLDNFTKDGNLKDSSFSIFIQIADLVAYAAYLKIAGEHERLASWQEAIGAGTLYHAIPTRVLNRKASRTDPKGLVRI